MKKNLIIAVFSVLLIVACWQIPVFSSGSFFDSIQDANSAGETGTVTNPQAGLGNDDTVIAQDTTSAPVSITSPSQVKVIISNIITQIVGQSFVKLGKPIQIIFLPPGTGGTSTSGTGSISVKPPSGPSITITSPKIPIQQPISSGTTSTPNHPNTPNASATARERIQSEYGINCQDGESKWSEKELQDCLSVLSSLPKSFSSATKTIKRDRVFMNNPNILGYVRLGIPTVTILDGASSRGKFRRTLVHEMTHTFQAANRSLLSKWKAMFWSSGKPVPPSVTSYGNTQDIEDMAESVAEYWLSTPRMKALYPERYEFIRDYVMNGREFN